MAKKKKASKNIRSKATRKKVKSQHPLKKASRLFLPYPVFVFLMLSVGVLLALWTFKTGAIDYTVKGKVPAAPLTEPAIIESPVSGARVSAVPINVSGSCPLESYVNLYRNDVFSGSALCSADKKFQIATDLFEGTNELRVRVFNLTDDEGPASDPITVYYDIPKSSPPTNVPAATKPLIIRSDFKYRGYSVGDTVKWTLEISGGNAPYAISADWGDGTTTLLSLEKAGQFSIEHIYEKASSSGSYEITINASDKFDRKTTFQFFIIVIDEDSPLIGGSTGDTGSSWFDRQWLKFIWPAYAILVLMAFSFWLGEREELIELRRQASRRGHRA